MVGEPLCIKTKIDNTEAEKDLNKLEKSCERTAKNIRKVKAKIAVTPESYGGASAKERAKWITVNNDSTNKKAKSRMDTIRNEIAEAEDYYNKERKKTSKSNRWGDDQLEKIAEMELMATEKLHEEYDHLIEQVGKYEQAKAKAAQVKTEEAQAKELAKEQAAKAKLEEKQAQETFKGASKDLSTEAGSTAFLSKIKTQEQYNAALATTKARMEEIEASARRIATEKGVDVNSLLNANSEYQKLDNRLKILTAHHDDFKKKTTSAFTNAEKMADKFGNSIKRGISKMSRYALAIFSVRGAYSAVRQVANSYIQDNEALANSIKGITGAFGELLGPAIEKVINLVKIAMSYIFAFIKALTGVDYVARYNAKALAKQTKATKDLAKAQRQTAAFDEQNKLSDTSASSGGASGGAGGGLLELPTLSDETLGKIQAFADKLKEAWNWIKENKEELIAMAGAVAVAFAIGSIVNWVNAVGGVGAAIGIIKGHLAGLLPLLTTIGGALLVGGGVFLLVDGFKDMAENGPNWKNILEILAGAIMVVVGAILIFNASLLASPITWIVIGIMALIAAIALCVVYWDEIKAAFEKFFTKAKEIFQKLKENATETWENIKEKFSEAFEKIKEKWDGVKQFFTDIWQKIKDVFEPVGTWFKEKFTTVWTNIKNVFSSVGSFFSNIWQKIKDVFTPIVTWFKEKFTGAWTAIKNVFSPVGTFFSNIWNTIKSKFTTIGTSIGNAIGGAFKKVVNSIISFAEKTINGFIRAINGAISLINKIPGVNIKTINTLQIPRLAKGGIVQNVGKGVPLIAGEAGREAILPLDNNTEWMDILVDKINGGNTTIPIYLDGRMIAKYIIDLQKRKAFATNGG